MLEELLNKYTRQRLQDYLSGFVYALNLERRARKLTSDEERVIAFYMAMCVNPSASVCKLMRMADCFVGIY